MFLFLFLFPFAPLLLRVLFWRYLIQVPMNDEVFQEVVSKGYSSPRSSFGSTTLKIQFREDSGR